MLRTLLPDRPGALGLVTTAMGTVGADIVAVEIIERRGAFAVTDFMLELPASTLPDSLVSVCQGVEGVRIEWVSHYPEAWGLESDIELLSRITDSPESATDILAEALPVVFRCHWSVIVSVNPAHTLTATELAPDVGHALLERLGDLTTSRIVSLPDGWEPGWGEAELMLVTLSGDRAVIAGRQGGPEWLASELARLRFLSGFVP